jgi:L-lactate dehydrogenase complex protein LldF
MHLSANNFKAIAKEKLRDEQLRKNLLRATSYTLAARASAVGEIPEWEELRDRAHHIKHRTIQRLAEYLEEFERNAASNGVHVLWAETAREANELVGHIARQRNARRIVKSKSMVTEEIGLNDYLEKQNIEVVETDLGEYIVQLNNEPPSHITAPALHLSRSQIGKLFASKLQTEYTDDPAELTGIARNILREKFFSAQIGISGANFFIADTGSIVIVENEGNARFVTTVPKTHIVITGIEKILPALSDLPLFLKLLPRSATGQRMTSYVSVIQSPRKTNDTDGPDEIFVILVDNNRSSVLGDPVMREVLYCIRCGACLNTCPVYQTVGGHAYGSVYPGPIGSILTPSLYSIENATPLPFASSLCGSCSEICPVKITIHHLLLYQRSQAVEKRRTSFFESIIFQVWKNIMMSEFRYRLALRLSRFVAHLVGKKGSVRVPVWSETRDFPLPAQESFHEWWGNHHEEKR